MTTQVKKTAVKKAGPVEIDKTLLTVEEKQIIKKNIKQNPGEFEILANELHFVSHHYLAWYNEDKEMEPILGELHVYRDVRYSGEQQHFNNQAFYFRCKYDGRLWRLKKISQVPKLIKALRKDVKIRYKELLNFSS